jgi:hypothetical protein
MWQDENLLAEIYPSGRSLTPLQGLHKAGRIWMPELKLGQNGRT